jgi:tetratricopeptide (TPR) repeat protein
VFFQRAIDLDPKFALAHVGIADSYFVMPSYGYLAPKEAMPKAIAAARRALEIDPDLAEAHSSLGSALSFEHRWAEAERSLKRSLEIDPNIAESHYRYALEYLAPTGRIDEAITEINRALELEPLSIPISANLAGLYIYARKNETALEHALKVDALEPGHATASYWLGWAYIANAKYSEAIALCEKLLPSKPENQDFLQIRAFPSAKLGRPDETRRVIGQLVEMEKRQYVVPYRVATLYAVLGEKDKAISELERSFVARDWDINRLKIDPFIDPVRADPRFAKLLDRLNLPE